MRPHSRPLPSRTAVSSSLLPSCVSVSGRRGSAIVRRAAVAQVLEQRRLLCGTSMDGLLPAPEFSSAIERHIAAEKAASDGGSASSDSVTLVWANRGQNAGVNNDYFDQAFGSNASKARAIVDAALADWSRAITSFNRPDGTTTLQINIAVNPTSAGNNAAAKPADTAPSDGLPHTGSITIDAGLDLHGSGYFFDDTPNDYSEFNSFTQNAFSGYPPSNVGADFYSAISLEITHVLGLTSASTGTTALSGYRFTTSGLATKTNIPDTDEGNGTGYFAVFNGPTIKHLLTTNNGGSGGTDWGNPIHTAGAGGRLFFPSGTSFQPTTINGITYYPSDDTGNAKYESPRVLPSEVVLDILHDAYGYTIQDPHTLPNFFASLNSISHVLTVRGAIGNGASDFRNTSADVITVDQSGSSITVSVDIGNDTPASGNLPGAGNLSAYTSTFNVADVSSIVIDGGGGNDTIVVRGVKPTTVNGSDGDDNIRVRGVVAPNTIVVNGGDGNDSISFGNTQPTLDDLNSNVTVAGGAGTDTIRFDDDQDPYGDNYTITANTFARTAASGVVTYQEMESLLLNSGNGSSTFNVNAIASTTPVEINCGGGVDTVNVGNHDLANIAGLLTAHGGGNGDRIYLDDLNQTGGNGYTLSTTVLKRNGLTSPTFDGFGTASVAGGSGSDTFFVTPSSTVAFSVNGNSPTTAPGDTLNLALSGVTGANNAGSGGSGTWTFSNRLSVGYNSIETQTSTGGTNVAPTISSLSASSSSVTVGQSVTLTANGVADADGNLASVAFYRESNNTAGYQAGSDTLLGTDTNGGDGWSYAYSTSGLSPAAYTFYAVAMDAAAATSAAVSTSVTVNGVTNGPPTISSFSASPNPVSQGSNATLSATASDSDGSVVGVNFYLESNNTSGLQPATDTSYGTGSFNGSAWTVSLPTNGLAAGSYTFYALAVDNSGNNSVVATTTLTVSTSSVPVITGLYGIPSTVATNTSFALLCSTITDSAGTVTSVAFYKETNGVGGLQSANDTLLGTDTTANDGWYLNPIYSGNSPGTFTYYAVATDNLGHVSAPVAVPITVQNEAAPTVTGATLYYNYAPIDVALTFGSDVAGSSIGTGDLYVYNLATNAVVPVDSVSYSSSSKLANFNLHGIPADGNYRAILSAGSVTAPLGTPLASNYTFDFFILGGDANHDRKVDFNDLLTLAKHYGASNMAYGLGDFDYNNTVNFSDLLILARNYGKTLAAPQPLAEAPALAPATARKRPAEEIVA